MPCRLVAVTACASCSFGWAVAAFAAAAEGYASLVEAAIGAGEGLGTQTSLQ